MDGGWDGEGVWHGKFAVIQNMLIYFGRSLRIFFYLLTQVRLGRYILGASSRAGIQYYDLFFSIYVTLPILELALLLFCLSILKRASVILKTNP